MRATTARGAIAGHSPAWLLGLFTFAACVHGGPPSVAPTQTLAPKVDDDGPRSTAPFQVVYFGPKGEVDDRPAAVITVLFNRAMRALDAPDDHDVPAISVKTKDGRVPAGKWRFVGTRGVVFEPDKTLGGASEYEVVVPKESKALDGSTLANEVRFGFVTSRPHVTHALEYGRNDVRPDSVLRIELDQSVDPAALQKVARLVVRTRPQDPPKLIPLTVRRAATSMPASFARMLEIVPSEKLPLDAAIELVIGSGLVSLEGPLPSQKDQIFAMRSYGPLRLADVRCVKQSMGRCVQHHRIEAMLSNDVLPQDFLAHLKVEGGEPAKLLVSKAPKGPRRDHAIVADSKAGKRYKVTIGKGLKDVFGQVLAKDIVFDVDVEAPFVGGKAGEAAPPPPPDDQPNLVGPPPPPPGVPHRPILAYDAQIGIQGQIVEALAKDGIKSHKVPIGVVNVPTVGVVAAKIGEPEVMRWFDGSIRASGPSGGGWAWDWWSPSVPESTRAVRLIDLDSVIGARGAGILALEVPGDGPRQSIVSVTDLAIASRMSKLGGVVWVTRLSTGAPVANASVRILRVRPKKKETVEAFSATTDANGIALVPSEKFAPSVTTYGIVPNEAIVIAKLGDDWTFQPIERSAREYGYDVDFELKATYKALVFTERGVYRPGETLKLAGVVRKGEAGGLMPPAGKDVRLRITDGEGMELAIARAKVDAYGTFAVDVPISKTAKYGTASISASVGDRPIAGTSFLLAAYKASAFKVAVEPAQKSWIHGDSASFSIHGEYLYGAAMAGATVTTTITRSPIEWRPPKTDDYVLVEEDAVHGWVSGLVDQPKGDLDPKGEWAPSVNLEMKGQWGPERLTLEAEVQDATNQTVAKSASAIVHPAEFYLGLLRGGAKFRSISAAPGKGGSLQIEPQVAAIDPSGAHRAGVAVKLELVERKYAVATAEQADGSTFTNSKPKDEVVASCTVTTTASNVGCPLIAKEVGQYRIRAVAKDPRGLEVRASTMLYVVSDAPDAQASWPKSDLRVLKLEPEKTTFKVGEKARILVTNPFKKATALVTVERAGVLTQEVVALEGSTPVIEVTVKKEWFPNVFLSIDLVRGRVQAPPAAGKGRVNLGGPEFRFGSTELRIDPESHRLKLAITPQKTQLVPGETFDADVAVSDQDGKPAKASITFYAVDEGVLMLTGYKTPDPLPPFAERQKLSVFGFDSRDHLAHIVPMKAGEKIPILGWDWPQPDGWNKGGQYGDGGESSPTPRADFRATAFFEAGRVTSDDGHAKFHIKLPDNLTSYRLMAVAASADDRFGFGESQVQASKKLMIRPALPRMVRVGDAFEASFVLTAKDMAATSVDVTLKAGGLSVSGPTTARVNVAPGQQVPVRFLVTATAPGTASLDVEARGGGAVDRVQLTRTIELPLAMKSVAAYGETSSEMAVKLGTLEGIRPDQGGLKVKMASSALVGLDSSFDRLIEYPYGCTEQLASRILPLVSLRELAKEASVRLPATLDQTIDGSIGKLLEHQDPSGGFGFWGDDPAVLWLSAYATLVLEEAANKGHHVPKESRDAAVAFLRARLPGTIPREDPADDDQKDAGPAEDDEHGAIGDGLGVLDRRGLQLANAAFVVDALASAGAATGTAEAGTLNRLYDKRKDMPLFAQALLLHAMAVAKLPQAQLDTFAKELESRLRIEPNEVNAQPEGPVYAPMLDSGARSTALVLRALVAANPKHPLAARLARGLLHARVDGAWQSTQENVWALLALDAYRRAQESAAASFEGVTFLGDDRIGQAPFQGMHEEPIFVPAGKLARSGEANLAFKVEGQGRMFWSAELRYATTVLPKKPLDRGFFVEKRVRSIAPDDLQKALATPAKSGATSAKVGQLVLVDLYLESSEPRDQVVIDDPLPAGLEPIDTNLETTAQSASVGDGPYIAHGMAKKSSAWLTPAVHREHRDDRVLTFLGHVDPGLYHFRYVARATAVGTFVVPPTHVEAMYAPEVSGRTAATIFTVVR